VQGAAERRQAAGAQARRITEGAQREAAQKAEAAAEEAGRVGQAAQAQARQIRQAAQAEAQTAQSPAPSAGQDRPERTTSVPSLSDLTREPWERKMELAMSVVPAYLRIYESAVKTFGAAYRQAGATDARASTTRGSDDQVTQSVSRLADAGAEGAARLTAVRERRRVVG
jgi:hypothetical protein